jgi:phage protein
MASTKGYAIGWDDEIIDPGEPEFVLLTPGVYDFTITGFERGHFDGSEKMDACSMAKLTLRCSNGVQETTVFTNLFLSSAVAFKLSKFAKSIGDMPAGSTSGQKFHVDWNNIIGKSGKCKIKTRVYNGKDYNEVDDFIVPDPANAPAAAPAPAPMPQAAPAAYYTQPQPQAQPVYAPQPQQATIPAQSVVQPQQVAPQPSQYQGL